MTADSSNKPRGEGAASASTNSTSILPVLGDCHLLAIGISNYAGDGTYSNLDYPHLDASTLANILHEQYGFKKDNITLLVNRDIGGPICRWMIEKEKAAPFVKHLLWSPRQT